VAKENNIRSIAFASISTGVSGYPPIKAADTAVKAVADYVSDNPDAFDLIEWVCFDERTLTTYKTKIRETLSGLSDLQIERVVV
ncbi:MAG: macro domain-containing protein, partial [Lachnospiraceae bacterium]|nr:macro domain-containing protein [Lachnospiraceae bacterium]